MSERLVVDANELKDWIKKEVHVKDLSDGAGLCNVIFADDFERAMSKFPGNAVESFGWIDIRNQKPEIGTEIIGLYAYGSIARFLVESHGSYRKDFTEEYCKVDYWMPMPELPEECR